MRTVGYYFKNNAYETLLTEFCKSEDLLASKNAEKTENLLFYITDDEAKLSTVAEDIPCCLISSEFRQAGSIYVLNANLSMYALRIVLDKIYHGDILWNSVDGLITERISKKYVMSNKPEDIERFVCLITQDLINHTTFAEIEKTRIGISEMLSNAIEHGNLNITTQEKNNATEDGSYQALLNERLIKPNFTNRRVFIDFLLEGARLEINITDEGEGFVENELLSPQEQELMRLHGRGILITRAYFDNVIYSKAGNSVRLIKYLQ